MSLRDAFHEWRIYRAKRRLMASINRGEDVAVLRQLWDHFSALLLLRSPGQVARMERRMGLR